MKTFSLFGNRGPREIVVEPNVEHGFQATIPGSNVYGVGPSEAAAIGDFIVHACASRLLGFKITRQEIPRGGDAV